MRTSIISKGWTNSKNISTLIIRSLFLIVMGFVNELSTIGFGGIFESIKGLIGSNLAILGNYIGKSFVRLFIKYLRWNTSILEGENGL